MTKKKSQLPKHPPKKTGKRGVGPADSEATPAPKQKELPGMEDRHLEDLEEAARNYAGVRDRRMALTRQETDLKDVLHTLMKRHQKQIYRVAEMEIKIVAKDETVKVKMLKDDD
jgi:hypothetical protein